MAQQSGARRNTPGYARRSEPVRWCTGTRRAGGKTAATGISGVSALLKVRYFLRRASRGREVVEEVMGDEFEGVLVSDFYGAYNVHQGLHQRCWTHLLRDIH